MTEVKAHNRHLRMSPRKVRVVVDVIRGMDVGTAIAQLTHMSKAAARPVRKLLQSAVANAKHNNKLELENLFVKSATVDQGPTIKRFRPRAMGASATILKRTSHVTVVLSPKIEPKKEEIPAEGHDEAEKKDKEEKVEIPAEGHDKGHDEKPLVEKVETVERAPRAERVDIKPTAQKPATRPVPRKAERKRTKK